VRGGRPRECKQADGQQNGENAAILQGKNGQDLREPFNNTFQPLDVQMAPTWPSWCVAQTLTSMYTCALYVGGEERL